MRTISLHANDHTVSEKATQIIWIVLDDASQESVSKNHIIFGNGNIILRHMHITNATVSKLNQFIEPKTTFAMFLSFWGYKREVSFDMKEME